VQPDREEAAIGETPEVVVDEMSDVTGRLGDRLWMIAPMTAGVVETPPDAEVPVAEVPVAEVPVTEVPVTEVPVTE
jgi:hypothetical protein